MQDLSPKYRPFPTEARRFGNNAEELDRVLIESIDKRRLLRQFDGP